MKQALVFNPNEYSSNHNLSTLLTEEHMRNTFRIARLWQNASVHHKIPILKSLTSSLAVVVRKDPETKVTETRKQGIKK